MRNAIRWVLAILALCGWGCGGASPDLDAMAVVTDDAGMTQATPDVAAPVVKATEDAGADVEADAAPTTIIVDPAHDVGPDDARDAMATAEDARVVVQDAGAAQEAAAANPMALDTCPASVPGLEPRGPLFRLGGYDSGLPSCYEYGYPTGGTQDPQLCCVTACPLSNDQIAALECDIVNAFYDPNVLPSMTELPVAVIEVCPGQAGATSVTLGRPSNCRIP